MRVIAVSHVASEEDIIEAFVRHTAKFCDMMIILDHGSADATPEILRRLKEEGYPLHLLRDPAPGYIEIDHLERLLKLAAHDFAADWIIGLDADEFIGGATDRSFLPPPVDEETPCLKVQMRSHYPAPGDRTDVPNPVERITHRPEKEPAVFKTFVPGWLARKEGALWTGGKHRLMLDGREAPWRGIPGVWLGHFSLRSASQYAIKLAYKQLQRKRHVARRGSDAGYYEIHYRVLRDEGFAAFAESFPGMSITWSLESKGNLVCDPTPYLGTPLRYLSPRLDTDILIRNVLSLSERLAPAGGQAAMSSSGPERGSKSFAIEVAGHPPSGQGDVQKFTSDPAWQVLRFRLDCTPETTGLHFHLCLEPGLLEIRRMTLNPANGAGTGRDLDGEAIKSMLRVLSGGLAVWSYPGTTCRLLTSRDPLVFAMSGWNFDPAALPGELIIELRFDDRLLLPTVLSPEILNSLNFERAELRSGLDECHTQLAAAQKELDALRSCFFYQIGAVIDFTDKGNSLPYRGAGWSPPEPWGTWTDGPRATLDIRFSGMPKGPVRMRVEVAQTFIHPLHPEMRVEVGLNGSHLALWRFHASGPGSHEVEIPLEKLRDGICGISFDIPNPASPAKLGLSGDARQLGIGIAHIVFEEAKAPVAAAVRN